MNPLPILALLQRAALHARVLAEAPPRTIDELGVGAAILLTTLGMALHWRQHGHRMSMEERVKDGKITEDEALQHIRFYARCAPVATLAGVTVLVYVLFHLSE